MEREKETEQTFKYAVRLETVAHWNISDSIKADAAQYFGTEFFKKATQAVNEES